MAAVDDFAAAVADRDEKNQWVAARNALHSALEEVNRRYDELDAMADAGIIASAPTDLRNELIWAFQQLTAFRQTMLDRQTYMDLHNWTP